MKTTPLIVIAALLVATGAQGRPLDCVLWPRSEACQPAPPVVVPPPAPAPAPVSPPAPAVAPQPPAAKPATAAPKPKAKPIRSNFAKPLKAAKRKAAALPSWCARVPSWASVERVIGAAPTFIGREMTPAEKRQAAACVASKKA